MKQRSADRERKGGPTERERVGWEGVANLWLLEDVHESDVDAEF